jgi:hypothetical protein
VQKRDPGEVEARLVATNPLPRREKLTVTLEGRGLTADQTLEMEVPAGGSAEKRLSFTLDAKVPTGRLVLPLRVVGGEGVDGCDAFVAVDVER